VVGPEDIQIVGMSATIGNLAQMASFLRAEVFERQFRPVELTEYVKLGDMLHRLVWADGGLELVPDRKLAYDVSTSLCFWLCSLTSLYSIHFIGNI
jgi:POLQ-like helicase